MSLVFDVLSTAAILFVVSCGLLLIFGVMKIINFAHGALLTLAMFAAWGANAAFGIGPYAAIPLLVRADGRIEAPERLAGWLGLDHLPGYLTDLAGAEGRGLSSE